MKIGKKIIIFTGTFVFFVAGVYFYVDNSEKFHLFRGVHAVGGFPYQIGLTSVLVTQCEPSCIVDGVAFCCAPSASGLCPMVVPGPTNGGNYNSACLMYSEVSGSPAGGMGNSALFLNKSIAQAGLASGGQLIAGGMLANQMDQGVLASAGGCAGCVAKANKIDKVKEVFDYLIASLKK